MCDMTFILQLASATHSTVMSQAWTLQVVLSQPYYPNSKVLLACSLLSPVLAPPTQCSGIAFGRCHVSVTFSQNPGNSQQPNDSLLAFSGSLSPHLPSEVPNVTSQSSSASHRLLTQLLTCPF